MALSNIFREPRREITESAVGIVVPLILITVFLWLDHLIVIHIRGPGSPTDLEAAIGQHLVVALGIFLGAFAVAAIVAFTHSMGESICDGLAQRGLELRPRNRPQGQG